MTSFEKSNTDRLRIALLAPLLESVPPPLYGGTERVVANLCEGLVQAGQDVTLFAAGDSSMPARLISVTDQALMRRNPPITDPSSLNFQMLARVLKLADEFDVIHNHVSYWMLPLSEMTRVPVVTTVHERVDFPEMAKTLMSYPHAYYVSISDAQRAPAPHLRWVRTVYHGLDLGLFKFHPQPGSYLAFLGRISPEKRPEWAIEIARLSGVPLKIAAKIEKGPDQEYYESRVKKHIDGKFIEYVGEISDLEKSDFLGNALALVFPTDCHESFGLVAIESLATGTPVLARPRGAVSEILADGITGYNSMDIRELARRVADVPSLDRRLCREWVETRYARVQMVGNYLAVYRMLREQSEGKVA